MPKYRHLKTGEEIKVSNVRVTTKGDIDLDGKYDLSQYKPIIDEGAFDNVSCKKNPKDKIWR